MSIPTATAMITPVVMFCHAVPTAWRLSTFWTIVMMRAPKSVETTFPTPPKRLVPPITAAAIAWSSNPRPYSGEPEFSCALMSRPPSADITPATTNTCMRTRLTLMPTKRAAASLPPTA
jgi:hypothetical protein